MFHPLPSSPFGNFNIFKPIHLYVQIVIAIRTLIDRFYSSNELNKNVTITLSESFICIFCYVNVDSRTIRMVFRLYLSSFSCTFFKLLADPVWIKFAVSGCAYISMVGLLMVIRVINVNIRINVQ